MEFDLAWAGALAFLGLAALLSPALGLRRALWLALFKVGLACAYFAWLDDGSWRLKDDLSYVEGAEALRAAFDPRELLLRPEARLALLDLAGGRNVGYFLFVGLCQELFGAHYWAAVLGNVVVSGWAALAVLRLLELAGFERRLARTGAIFFALHWDVVAWSSFVNLKDSLVLALTAWALVGSLSFLLRPRWAAALAFSGAMVGLAVLRWYAPALVALVLVVWLALHGAGWRLLLALFVGALALAWALLAESWASYVALAQAAEGLVRVLATPRPWAIEPAYSFLLVPAILHWASAPFLAVGLVLLWRHSSVARALVLFALVVIAFYALVPELQGPRHRLSATLCFAPAQLFGLLCVLRSALGRARRSPGDGELGAAWPAHAPAPGGEACASCT
jgi:hypothetical protein